MRSRSHHGNPLTVVGVLGALLMGTVLLSFFDSKSTTAQSPTGDIAFDQEDLDHILNQIKIAERHAAGENLDDILVNRSVSAGLRTVNGRFNHVHPGQEHMGQADLEFPTDLPERFRAAQNATHYNQGDGQMVQDPTPRIISQLVVNQSVENPAAAAANDAEEGERIPGNNNAHITGIDQFFIPNTAPDEGLSAPTNAWFTFFGQFFSHGLDLVNKGGNGFVYMPLTASDPLYEEGSMTNFMLMTRATVDAGPDGVIGTADDVSRDINATTPHVDQNQTYTSHESAQVILRHYELRDGVLQNTGRLLDGYGDDRILDNEDDGGLATWDTVQAQALEKFGIELDDLDGNNMPWILADYYGNFIPGDERGLPLLVTSVDPMATVEGNNAPGEAVDATQALRINHSFFLDVGHTANPIGNDGQPRTPDEDDVINALTNELPDGRTLRGARAESPEGFYDDELLGMFFACGDGRCNENVALTTVHHVFHREHNRFVSVVKRVLLDTGDLSRLNEWLDTELAEFPAAWAGLPFAISDGSLASQATAEETIDALGLDWNGERVFQAARWGVENQYNRIIFDEFSPSLAGLKNVFENFDSELDPTVLREFAHSVYRFGHSMLTETVDRFDTDFQTLDNAGGADLGADEQLFLFEAFLNPLLLMGYDEETGESLMSPEEGAGAVARGITRQTGNEIDEFITGALQNNVYGLPLDLGAINIARGRDTALASMNETRRAAFLQTRDGRMKPYESWVDYLDNLRHEETLVNFIAAYGTHPTVAGPDGIVGSADDIDMTYAERRAAACAIVGALTLDGGDYCESLGFAEAGASEPAPADALDFLFGLDVYASGADGVPVTGLDDIDLWVGGLAEERMPFGGYLGSTTNYVFEKQMEELQDGDRFYYVIRNANIHFLNELESNSFTSLVMRNTDMGEYGAGTLPLNIFSVPHHNLEINIAEQFGPDPEDESPTTGLIIRDAALGTTNIDVPDPDLYIQYTGGDHATIGGSDGADTIIGGIGDDALWGRAGDDRIEGGDGADLIEGGPGDDIITDLSGPDVIEGGPGNDAISSGNEEDVIFGDEGKDFIVNPHEFGEIFAGLGDDFVFDGIHLGHIRGGAGDDWLENLGGSADLFQADNGVAAELGESPVKGNDVMICRGGDNDCDMESGDDIVVDGPGIERVEGQLGFDWVSFANDGEGVNVDLDLTIFLRPVLPPSNDTILNRYDRVEAISGSDHSDILRGTANRAGSSSGNELAISASHNGFALIDGYDSLVPSMVRGPLAPDPVTGEAQTGWTGGDILLGAGGGDLLVGEAGNDIIDGDSQLLVGLDAGPYGIVDSMEDLFGPVFDGDLNPGDINISRRIRDADFTNQHTDSVLFSGNRADYNITAISDALGGMWYEVEDTRAPREVVGAVDDGLGNEGTDLVRNIERMYFDDQVFEVPAGNAGAASVDNSLVTGTPMIMGIAKPGNELTAILSGMLADPVMDVDNVTSGGAVDPDRVDWVWEIERQPGSNNFDPIIRLPQILGVDRNEIHGNPFLVTTAEVSFRVRATGIFQDEKGAFEIVRSDPVVISGDGGPNAPAIFAGDCTSLDSFTPVVLNKSRPGEARLDFSIPSVPLALFQNTEAMFGAGFDGAASMPVGNLHLTFLTNASMSVTGQFGAEITAIVDEVTGAVDPSNVNVLWSIRDNDVGPLVNGPTTASFTLDLCGSIANALLDGDSSAGDAQGVTVTLVNGEAPLSADNPGAPASFIGDCVSSPISLASLADSTPIVENRSIPGLPRLDFTIQSVPLSAFVGTDDAFGAGFLGTAEQAVSNLTLTFINPDALTVSGTFGASIVAIVDEVTSLVDPDNVDIIWSIRGAEVAPLVDGTTRVTFSQSDCPGDFATATLSGDSSENSAVGVSVELVNGLAPVEDQELLGSTFTGDCADLAGVTPIFENRSRPGLARLDFSIPSVPVSLFSGADRVASGAVNELGVNNLSLLFVNDGSMLVTGSFAAEIIPNVDEATGTVDPDSVDIVWSIRGDEAASLVSGPTSASFTLNPVGMPLCAVASADLTGDSSVIDAQGVSVLSINSEAPVVAGDPAEVGASFIGGCGGLDNVTPIIENRSTPGLPRLDVTIADVFLGKFSGTETSFPVGFGADAEMGVSTLLLSFVDDDGDITGSFQPEIVAIVDEVTGAVDSDNVNIVWSIRGAAVAPLVDGLTTANFSLIGCAGTFATAQLDGDSSVDAETITVEAVNNAVAAGEEAEPEVSATFNGACADLAAFTPQVGNASRPGLARFDILIPSVPLSSFDGAESQFSPGFDEDAEIEVSNLELTFVSQTDLSVTGMFTPEIVAIVDEATGAVDPDNVDIYWSIRGAAVAPLVPGLAMVSFRLDGCEDAIATAQLEGDSSVADGQDVEFTTVNGDDPILLEGTITMRRFVRGECNNDGQVNLADALCSLNWLFFGGRTTCVAALNSNGDTRVNIADPVSLLSYLFSGGDAPGAPFPACAASSLSADQGFGCVSFSCQ